MVNFSKKSVLKNHKYVEINVHVYGIGDLISLVVLFIGVLLQIF